MRFTKFFLVAIFTFSILISCDTKSGAKFEGFEGFIRAMTISDNGKYLVVAFDNGDIRQQAKVSGLIKIIDLEDDISVQTFQGHSEMVLCVDISPDNNLVVSGSYDIYDRGEIKIWSLTDQEENITIGGLEGKISSILFLDNNRFICATYGKTQFNEKGEIATASDTNLSIYNATTGDLIKKIPAYAGPTWLMMHTPDGKHIITRGHDGTRNVAKIWDKESWEIVKSIDLGDYYGTTMAMTQDQRYLIYGILYRFGTVVIYDLENDEEVRQFEAHEKYVYFTRVTPDGKYIITAGNPGVPKQPAAEIFIWDFKSGELVERLLKLGKHFYPTAIALSPDGKDLYTADWRIFYWNLQKELYKE